jgi:hypothetical protein
MYRWALGVCLDYGPIRNTELCRNGRAVSALGALSAHRQNQMDSVHDFYLLSTIGTVFSERIDMMK